MSRDAGQIWGTSHREIRATVGAHYDPSVITSLSDRIPILEAPRITHQANQGTKIRMIIARKGDKEKTTKGLGVMGYQIASVVVHSLSFLKFYICMKTRSSADPLRT